MQGLAMSRTIRISAGDISVLAELNDTQTAQRIWDSLPFRARGNRWGDEIYFGIPVSMDVEAGQEVVEVGDLGYWPPGRAFCIFFGPTPASRGSEARAASPVTVFGRVLGDATAFRQVPDGVSVSVEQVEANV